MDPVPLTLDQVLARLAGSRTLAGEEMEGLDLHGRVGRSDHQRRQQVESRVRTHVTEHAEAVAVGQARRGGQEIRDLAS